MFGRAGIYSIVIALVFLSWSCVKIPDPTVAGKGDIVVEMLPHKDAIPLEWGKLLSVSDEPGSPGWVQLWFVDQDSTIRMVAFDIYANEFSENARVIRRP